MGNEFCYAKNFCKKYGSEGCTDFCDIYIILKAIYMQANIPKKYQYDTLIKPTAQDLEAYKQLDNWKLNIVNHVENGDNLYIYSENTGNGKTTWATKIANYYIRKMVFSREIEDLVIFINVSKFLEDMRINYSNRTYEFEVIKQRLMKAKLAIFDDIGTEKGTDWVVERLYEIINYRDNNLLSIIYTSNYSYDVVGDRLDKRIKSRLKNATHIKLIGEDRR